jgi:CRP/FNR family cyclic AMP-dependent transcriptional regulator
MSTECVNRAQFISQSAPAAPDPVTEPFVAKRDLTAGPDCPGPGCMDPIYIFYCGLRWLKQADNAAGWDLIQALRSSDLQARGAAAERLAKARHSKILARHLRHTRNHLPRLSLQSAAKTSAPYRAKTEAASTPYGLKISDDYLSCKLQEKQWFCSLSTATLKALNTASYRSVYPSKAIIFMEGQPAKGVFVLCSGKVKLSIRYGNERALTTKVVEAGELLGLSAVLSGMQYETTAETVFPSQVNFIKREELLQLAQDHGELGFHFAKAVSMDFGSVYRIHQLVLAPSAAGRLATLLLSCVPDQEKYTRGTEIQIRNRLTTQEMAEMIASSRENVSRLLRHFETRNLIRVAGATLVIRNYTRLEAMAEQPWLPTARCYGSRRSAGSGS